MIDPGFRMNVSNVAGSNPNALPDFEMRGQANMGNYDGHAPFSALSADFEPTSLYLYWTVLSEWVSVRSSIWTLTGSKVLRS